MEILLGIPLTMLLRNAPADPTAPTFHPETRYPDSEVAGELEQKDLEWLCAGGFVSETQTYYNFAQDGTLIYCQVVHSSIGYAFISSVLQLQSKQILQRVVPNNTIYVQIVQPKY